MRKAKIKLGKHSTCTNCGWITPWYIVDPVTRKVEPGKWYVCLGCQKEYCILCWASVPGTEYLCPDFPKTQIKEDDPMRWVQRRY